MLLRELFVRKPHIIIVEGGNAEVDDVNDPNIKHRADRIDLAVHNRTQVIGILDQVLHGINQAFEAQNSTPLWNPQLLKSREFLGGSSLHFFNVPHISDEEFLRVKPVVGDIDTQCDRNLEPQVKNFLTTHHGRQVGPAKLLGFSNNGGQFNALFEITSNHLPIKVQIDFEFGEYDQKTNAPTPWYRFSHNSEWNDLSAQEKGKKDGTGVVSGIKGVFHKYLYRSLTKGSPTTKYVQMKTKLKGPITDSNISFAVHGTTGGGLSQKYQETGREQDGIPIMIEIPTKDRPYIQDLNQQFELFFGRQPNKQESEKQKSFVGTIDLMNTFKTPEENQITMDAFIQLCFEVGSQMINRDDPEGDRAVKMSAINYALAHLNLTDKASLETKAKTMAADYEEEHHEVEQYKKDYPEERQPRAQVAKLRAARNASRPLTEAEVKAQLRKGMPHLRDLKPMDLLDLLDELHDNGKFELKNIPLNVKVDGFGGRFGKNAEGKPFMGTSRTEPRYEPGFVKYHQQKGTTDPDILGRAQMFDDLFNEMMKAIELVDSKLGPEFLVNKQVTCEVLFIPFATETPEGKLKFVGIHYDKLPEGIELALVPFHVSDATTGESIPDGHKVVEQLTKLGQQDSVMFINNRLTQNKALDVTAIVPPMENIEQIKAMLTSGKLALKREAKEILQPIALELEKAIINDPNIVGKNLLGDEYEGIVINSRLGPIKVTSQEQRQIIANKNAAKAAARAEQTRENTNKTAVVAIGSFVGHKGHQELWNYTVNKAKELGGDPYLFIGNAEGKDDPIPPSIKVQTWHKLYPQYASHMSTVTHEGGTLLQKIKHELINPLPGKPPRYDNIVIMVGEDRANMNIAQVLMKAVNKFAGYEHVRASLDVTPRGQGVSGTQLRKMAALAAHGHKEPAMEFWRDAFNGGSFGAKPLPDSWIKHLMQVTQQGMGMVPGASVNVVDKRDPNPQPQIPAQVPAQDEPPVEPLNIKEANNWIRKMRASEFTRKQLNEKATITAATKDAPYAGQGDVQELSHNSIAGLNNAVSYPDISMNKSNGSSYLQYRFGLALAGAHPNADENIDMPTASWFAGDPLLAPYSDADLEIIKAAGKTLGIGNPTVLSDRSREPDNINKNSPVAKPKRNKYGI